jgi:hypothetical protein
MATAKQKEAARKNLEKARAAKSRRRTSGNRPSRRLDDHAFAFPDERKEPLTDAAHVRNAIARFDQVEGVTDRERDEAWRRILSAARKYDIEVEADDWRELFVGGKARKR